MSLEKAILGAVIGVGAVAAAPFTGGGSVLGAATLAGSLSGIGTCIAAAAAAAAGAALGDEMGDSVDYEAYDEGYEDAKREYATPKQLVEDEFGPAI